MGGEKWDTKRTLIKWTSLGSFLIIVIYDDSCLPGAGPQSEKGRPDYIHLEIICMPEWHLLGRLILNPPKLLSTIKIMNTIPENVLNLVTFI